MTHRDTVLSLLPKLKPDEWEEVINKCRLLLQLGGGAAPHSTEEEVALPERFAYLIDGLREELKARSLPFNVPARVILRLREYKRFLEDAPTVDEWMVRAVKNMSRTEKLTLSALLARCLALHISTFTQVSLANLLHYYRLAPEAFEYQFPGYASQDWVRHLLRKKADGKL